MTINEHWAKVSSELPGGLWWENLQLKCKNMLVGWGNKKATEWEPAHELLQISLAAHVKDVSCLHCSGSNLKTWGQMWLLEQYGWVERGGSDDGATNTGMTTYGYLWILIRS